MPLIQKLTDIDVSQIWYAGDAAAGGSLQNLRSWWDHFVGLGKACGEKSARDTKTEGFGSHGMGCFT